MPVISGSLIGSLLVSSVADETFEQIFGILMIPLLVVSLRTPKPVGSAISWRPA